MYIFLNQTVKVIHFPLNIPIISIGQRINQHNFHINLFLWWSGEDFCPYVDIHDYVASRVILDCEHMSKQTWSRDKFTIKRLYLLDRYCTCDSKSRCFLYISNNLVQEMECSVVVNK
jgi:hypothetical protein